MFSLDRFGLDLCGEFEVFWMFALECLVTDVSSLYRGFSMHFNPFTSLRKQYSVAMTMSAHPLGGHAGAGAGVAVVYRH